jgi:multiple sugar transport system permease protein
MAFLNQKGLKRSKLARQEAKWGFIFISPWIIGFLVFYLIPMVASLGFSLFNFNPIMPDQTSFAGLANWKRMVVEDSEVFWSVVKIFKFGAITLPISLGAALFLAILLNSRHLFATNIFRTLFYMPTMIPLVASVLIWRGVLDDTGWINLFLEQVLGIHALGTSGIRWLHNPSIIYFTYAIIGLWAIGNAMLIMLAGLQKVPTELYEAALVDGAGWWSRLFRITLPMISPVLFYNLVIGMIVLMQYFLVPYILVNPNAGAAAYPGYPEGATNFIMVYFYLQSFSFFNMGYGAAIAWVMFLIVLILTLILFGTAKYWVYYGGEKQ